VIFRSHNWRAYFIEPDFSRPIANGQEVFGEERIALIVIDAIKLNVNTAHTCKAQIGP
jgi:hypothetical protein